MPVTIAHKGNCLSDTASHEWNQIIQIPYDGTDFYYTPFYSFQIWVTCAATFSND